MGVSFRIDNKTLEVLESFMQINPSLHLQEGTEQVTINHGTARAVAKVSGLQPIPTEIAFQEGNRLISEIKSWENGVIVLEDGYVTVTAPDSPRAMKIRTTDPKHVYQLPTKYPSFETNVSFHLPAAELEWVNSVARRFGFPYIVISGDGKNVYIKATNVKRSNDVSEGRSRVGDTDKVFSVVFRVNEFRYLFPGSYDVSVGFRDSKAVEGLGHFVGKRDDGLVFEYWIVVEAESRPSGLDNGG